MILVNHERSINHITCVLCKSHEVTTCILNNKEGPIQHQNKPEHACALAYEETSECHLSGPNSSSVLILFLNRPKMCKKPVKGPPPPCQILQPLQMNTLLFLHYFVISDILIGMLLLQQT